LRKTQPYEVYESISFSIPFSVNGDSYDRYIVRMAEMRQSLHIIYSCLNYIQQGSVRGGSRSSITTSGAVVNVPNRFLMKNYMESLIQHFKYYGSGFNVSKGNVYVAIESPKGEFGVFLASTGMTRPYRCKIRTADFFHLQVLESMTKGLLLADAVTVIGSQDLVLGSIDR